MLFSLGCIYYDLLFYRVMKYYYVLFSNLKKKYLLEGLKMKTFFGTNHKSSTRSRGLSAKDILYFLLVRSESTLNRIVLDLNTKRHHGWVF